MNLKNSFVKTLLVLLIANQAVQAQWLPINATTGSIYYNNGNVGVGTSTPEGKFTISQIANGWNDGLRINRDASNYLTLTEDVSDIRLRNWGLGGIFFYTSSGQVMTILNNGNMGIGTSNPQKRLHVEAPAGETLRLSMPNTYVANAGPEIAFWNSTNEALASIAGVFKESNQGNYGNLVFKTRTNDTDKLQTKMVILSNGNVGIGTTDPGSFKLAVNGKIWSQEVNIAMTNPGPDYVFEKDYNLLSLAELEAYIKANKHLPEVPSAKEMDAEGLNLKEMNLILLKKVEELTLHLIEANKRIEALEGQAKKK